MKSPRPVRLALLLALLLFPVFAHAQQIVHVMANDITISGTLVHICDTVIIVDPAERDWTVTAGGSLRETVSVPIDDVVLVRTERSTNLTPMVLGTLAGLVVGGVMGEKGYENRAPSESLNDLAKAGSTFLGMIGGGLIGTAVGGLITLATAKGEVKYFPYKPQDRAKLREMAVFPEQIPSTLHR